LQQIAAQFCAMLRFLIFSFFFIHLFSQVVAQPGDTTVVQTFTWEAQNNPATAYDSPGRRWFNFPSSDNNLTYQKILMYYNLKCFSDGTAGNLGFPCGEWDYLTYTYLYDHTGVIDSVSALHPNHKINNLDFDEAHLTTQPAFITREYNQDLVVIDSEQNVQSAIIGAGTTSIAGPFSLQAGQRSLYLYRASDLMDAGLQAGDEIGKIAMNFSGTSMEAQALKIEFLLTTQTELNSFISQGTFHQAYLHDTSLPADGWMDLNTQSGFSWDGTSSLLVQISHNNPDGINTSLVQGDEQMYPCSFITSSTDRYMKFDWQDEVKLPAEVFSNVTDQISISFWQFGDSNAQPQDGTIFEGANAQNQRMLNAHLPWSNGRVYWDAGNDGAGYDRIDKLAQTTNYEGKWNHWCFTKNTSTGSMKIYLNGVLWHSGSNFDNSLEGIERFSIGGATTWSNFYRGSVDEFAVFNTELDASTIQQWMAKDLDESHIAWTNLQAYYQFNEPNQEVVLDASSYGRHAWMHGNANRILYKGDELWRNGSADFFRPQIRLTTGDFVTHDEVSVGNWIEEIPPVSIVDFIALDYQIVPLSVTYAWEEQNSYTIDVNGDTLNEILVPAEYTLNNEEFSYWQQPFEVVNRYELNRFITMYGIQLSLGTDGWTWVTDVTDWAPLLRDSVELESGNWQELLDLKFVFIEGTPAREVKRVERLWDSNLGLSTFDDIVVDKTIGKQEGESMWKIATTNTGHGFGFDNNNCGEFCNNIQSVEVNGQEQWSWDILQKCSTNPLYPQGGTWIYDRAGWCPGMNSTTKEFELTPFVQESDSFTVDYDISYDPYGNYVFFTTLFGYGDINHARDPEIDMITAPSDWKIHSRWNPMCDNPKFILRNKGSQPLTDLNIYFGVVGGETQTFHWTGNLGFMQSEEVELIYTDPLMWEGDDEEQLTFFVQLGMSADGADNNPSNNYTESHFTRPPIYQYTQLDDNRVIIQLKTNLAYTQSSYSLYDIDGNVVFERSNFDAPLTTYRDTVALNQGCYMFHLRDSGEDGLSFFANDDGNGLCKFDRVGSFDLVNFERDFGKEIIHYFYWKTNVVSVLEQPEDRAALKIYPNPANHTCSILLNGFQKNATIEIYDQYGLLVRTENLRQKTAEETLTIDISKLGAGVYQVRASDGKAIAVGRLIKV
jgi:hypothetical protein